MKKKQAQKECKTWNGWVRKLLHGDFDKRLKLDHADKWYIHRLESVLGNETHKIFWDFETQTDHPIADRKPDLEIINKKNKRTCHLVDFVILENKRVKMKENER